MTPGETLRLHREGRMTQRQLADSVGVTPQAISLWEKDRSMPDRAHAAAADDALNAGGDVLAAFGYVPDAATYEQRIRDLERKMAALLEIVHERASSEQFGVAARKASGGRPKRGPSEARASRPRPRSEQDS